MFKLLSKKRIVAMLLALTLICTMFSSLSLVMPLAETPADEGTYVIHAVGKSDATLGRAFFIHVPADKVVAGETYTASVTVQGVAANNANARILVKNGSVGTATKIGDSNGDTLTMTYSGAYVWTETITMPETIDTTGIYIGLRLNASNFKTLNTYFGDVKLIDKDGNNVVPKLTSTTAISGAAGADHLIQGNEANNWTTLQTEKVEDVADAALKQTLFNNFYAGDSMINLKPGTSAKVFTVFKKVPASKLKAETTYKLSIKYSGTPTIDQYRYFVIREGNTRTNSFDLGTATQLTGYVDCYEYTADYTTGATAQDLYIGLHLNQSGWNLADFTIADMQLVEDGKTENLFTSLSDMTDYYSAISTEAHATISPLKSAESVVITKQALNRDKYFEPEDLEAAKFLVHAVGKSDAAQGRALYVKVPAANIEAGKTYTVSMTMHGIKPTGQDTLMMSVRSGHTSGSTRLADSIGDTLAPTMYSGGYTWTDTITIPATKNDLYIGVRFNAGNFKTADFYLGDIKVIDENGTNVAPAIMSDTALYGSENATSTIGAPSVDWTKAEIVRMDKADESIKQTLFNTFYNGDSMLNLKMGTTKNMLYVYKKIPASKLKANTKYNLRIRYENTPFEFNDFRYFLIREGSQKTIHTTLGTYTKISEGLVDCNEFAAEYTTGDTAQDLYVGVRMNGSGWELANLYIGDMQFVEDGKKENLITPLSDMTDLYCSRSDDAAASVDKLTTTSPATVCNYVSINKQVLDRDKYLEPVVEPEDEDKYVIHVDGKDDASSGVATFVKVPADQITANKKYTAKVTVYGKALNGADCELLVRAGAANGSTILARTGSGDNKGTVTAPAANTVAWTVDVTPTTVSDLYIGIRLNKTNTQNADFYIGNFELIDENGNNVAPNLAEDTVVYNAASATNSISQWAAATLAAYLTKQEIVNVNTLDAAAKQAFVPTTDDEEDDEEEEDTATYLIHVDGKDDGEYGVATFVKVPADKITANKKYTAKITVYGKPLSGADSELLIRAGADNGSTILARTGSGDNKGTVTAPAANTVAWTVDVTPTTASDLYIGIRLNIKNTKNADFYIGNIELIDENGNNVAPKLSANTVVYNAASATNTISVFGESQLALYVTKQEIVDIETVDATVKEAFLAIGGGESGGDDEEDDGTPKMLRVTRAVDVYEAHTIYKKISADKITAGAKYKISIKFSGVTLGGYDFVVMRDNVANGSNNVITSVGSGEVINCGQYYKFDYEYTAPEAPTDLYIGIYLRKPVWETAELIIGEMKFVKEGATENLFTPLGDTSDLYRGYNGKTIHAFNSSDIANVIKLEKLPYDSVKFADVLPPDPSEAANKMAHIKGHLKDANVAWVYKKVENVPAGKYVASYLHNGTALNNKILFHVKTDSATLVETYQGGYREGNVSGGYHEIELTGASTVYVGYKISPSVMETVDINVATLGLQPLRADGSLGENLVTPVGNTTDWINNTSGGNKTKIFFDADGHASPYSNPTVYTIDIVNKDKSLFPQPDYMLHVKGNANADDSVVTEIPANKLKAGKSYTVEFDINFLLNALDKDVYFAILGGSNSSSWTEVIYGSAQVGYAFESVKTNGARIEYTFTLDDKKFDKYYAGFYVAKSATPAEFYLSRFSIYETADKNKTNLISDITTDMTKWYNNAGTGTATALGDTKAVAYDRYNATLMYKPEALPKTMLHVTRDKNTSAELRLKIDKSVIKPNVDYVFTFKYKNLAASDDKMLGNFVVFADDGTTRPGKKYLYSSGGSGTPFKEKFHDGVNGYFVVNISSKEYDAYTSFFAGWSYGAGSNAYIADFVMYEKDDPTKKNLLPKDEYSTNMQGWYNYSRDAIPSEYINFFGTSYVPYDDSLFKREIVVSGSYNAGDRIVHKLDKSKLSAGKDFTINLNYFLGGLVLDKDVSIVIFGDSNPNDNVYADKLLFGATAKAYTKIINGKSNREYFFQFTKEILDKYDNFYVGFYFNKKADNVDIHFANFIVTEVGASEAAFQQHRSEARVTGWCTGTEKLSVNKLSRDIRTEFYNGRQYPTYVFSELNDGEWWTEESVEPIEIVGDATLKGTIYGLDGKPLKNTKIRIVSDDITYEVKTNAKGEFVFEKVKDGFYQIFYLDAKGNLIDIEYGVTLERGSTVILKIEMSEFSENADGENWGDTDSDEGEIISGNIYTADLKVVKGLKVYLRGIGETVTDENGYFEFKNVPVGTYDLYVILANGKEYILKTFEIKEGIDIITKIKYAPETAADAANTGSILWIIIIAVAGLLIIGTGAVLTVLVIKTKKKK